MNMQGECRALAWIAKCILSSFWALVCAPFDLFPVWRVIRPFTQCGLCDAWIQNQVYVEREGICDGCYSKWLQFDAKFGPPIREEDIPF